MARMLEGAGETADGLGGCARTAALTGIYLYAVKVWKNDDSPDMGKTMAALDKALTYAEETANSFEEGSILSTLKSFVPSFKRDHSDA
jgi:hypothetical protein